MLDGPDGCARKLAWRYVAGIKSPQSASSALGDEIESRQLAPYLTRGKPFDYTTSTGSGYMAAALLEYLPDVATLRAGLRPQDTTPGLTDQVAFDLPAPTWRDLGDRGFAYTGKLDLWVPDGAIVPEVGRPSIPCVIDFKSTSSMRYAKSPDALRTDPQALLYGLFAMRRAGVREVDLVWLYTQTKGPRRGERRHVRMTAEEIVAGVVALDARAVKVADLRRAKPDPLSLPANTAACDAYGGCPYRANCNLSPEQHLEAAFAADTKGVPTMSNAPISTGSLMDRMRAKRAAAGGAPTPPPPPAPTTHFGDPSTAPAPTTIPAAFLAAAPASLNPPEAALPPAAVSGPAAAADALAGTQAAEPPKRGPGRPRRTPVVDTTTPAALQTPVESAPASVAGSAPALRAMADALVAGAGITTPPRANVREFAEAFADAFFARLAVLLAGAK